MESLGQALSTLQWILSVLLPAALIGWVVRVFVHQRRGNDMVLRLEDLRRSGLMGLQVEPGGVDGAPGLSLSVRDEAAEASALHLDTDRRAEVPGGLTPLELGVPALDARFVARAGTPGARQGLETARSGALQIAGDFFDGWFSRFTRIAVTDDRVRFTFGTLQVHRLEQVLPRLAWLAGVFLAVGRWLPPSRVASASAFRGGADVAPDAAVWYLELGPEQRSGPFTLEQLVQLLRQGRISWLTRAGREPGGGPLLPLARQPALQTACLAPDARGEAGSGSRPVKLPEKRRRRLFDFLQYDLVLLALLTVAWIANCQAGDDFARAGRGKRSAAWPTAPGEITRSTMETREGDETIYYRPGLAYFYRVGGREYSGSRLRYGYIWRYDGYSNDRGVVEATLARYPEGKQVRVAYNPKKPTESVLEPGLVRIELISGVIRLAVLGLVVLLFAVVGLARLRAHRARSRVRRAMCPAPDGP